MIKEKEIEITKKDYLTFRYLGFLYDYTGIIKTLWVLGISIAVIIDFFITRRSVIIALLGVFMFVSYVNSIFFKLPKIARAEFDNKTFPNPKYKFSISETTLYILRENSSPSEINLSRLHSAFETNKQFCFFISKNNYIILPKSTLMEDEIRFIKKAIKSLPRQNKKNPFAVELRTSIKNLFYIIFITVCAVLLIYVYKIT